MTILNALTNGILAGLTAVGFMIVIAAVYCGYRALNLFVDFLCREDDDDAGMDD